MMNVEEGLTDTDYEIYHLLRRSNKPVYIVINKVDSSREELPATEFYQLGIDKYFTLSSATGSGTGDLLDDVVRDFLQQNIKTRLKVFLKLQLLVVRMLVSLQ